MSLFHWARLLAWLAAETTALVAVAALFHLRFNSPRCGRTLWRAVLTAVALVWIVELSGLREKIPVPDQQRSRFILAPVLLQPSASQTGANDRRNEAAAIPAHSVGPSAARWPGLIWLGGSLLLLARLCVAQFWLAARRRAAKPADAELLELIARWQSLFRLRHVQTQVWPNLRSPVAFGIFQPAIGVPSDFVARFTSVERDAMIAHEMAHLAAHDPFWLIASEAVIALAWWHPLLWWVRRQLQFANEAVADEASALVPGGAHALAEGLVRLGREFTSSDPVRALGVGGMGLRSHLAARIGRLMREPRPWQPSSLWTRCLPHASAIFAASAFAILPIQTGLSGSILTVFAVPPPSQGQPPSPPQAPGVSPSQTSTPTVIPSDAAAPPDAAPNPVAIPPIVFVPETSSKTKDVSNSSAAAQPEPKHLAVADVATPNVAVIDFRANVTRTVSDVRPVLHDKEAGARPKVSLTFTAVITENESDDIGLDWIFGLAPTNNPALEVSHDGTALQTSPPLRGQSLVIDRFHTRGQSVVLKPEQFAALCDRIVRKWDLLNSPACVTASGLQAHIAVQDVTEVVTDVKVAKGHGTNGISVGYITDDIAVGPVVDILPTRMENGRWRLRVIARETTFIGYDNYGREFGSLGLVSVPGGKPLGYQIPHPHFRSVEISSDDDLSLGQTLALRGPLWTEVTRTKGGFFSRAKTKTVRERLYVFVTPTAVPAPALEK